MFRKIKSGWYNLKNGIESLIVWFPVIWKDRQWDHVYIYQILRHKLHLTEDLIRNYGVHTKNIQDADKIKVCVNLLDRLINDEYCDSAYKTHEDRWGVLTWKSDELDNESETDHCLLQYPNVKTPQDKEREVKDFRRAAKHETMLREQDLGYLFTLMRKHIQSWWD